MTDQPTRPDLVIEASLIAEMIETATPCRGELLLHVAADAVGPLDVHVVQAHELACPTHRDAKPAVAAPVPDDGRTTAQICADILVELGRIRGLIDGFATALTTKETP